MEDKPLLSKAMIRILKDYGNLLINNALISMYGIQYIQNWVTTNYPEIKNVEIRLSNEDYVMYLID